MASTIFNPQWLLDKTEALASIGGWELDLVRNTLLWTKQVYLIHEVEENFLPTLGNSLSFYTPRSLPIINRVVTEAVQNGRPFSEELEITTAKGARKIVHMIGEVNLDSHGHPVSVIGTFQDITPRKSIEASLETQRNYVSLLLDVVETVLVALDRSGRVTLLNRKGHLALDFQPGTLIGRDWFDHCVPPEVREAVRSVFRKFIEGDIDPVASYENELLTRTGQRRLFYWRNAVLRDSNGEIIGTLSAGEDITDRERLIHEAETNQRLESLGLLAGGIAHDFNNLLAGIYGHIDLARLICREPEVLEPLDQAAATMKRARALTGQLLTFAEGGAPVFRTGDISKFILETVSFALSGTSVRIVNNLPLSPTLLSFDPNQLAQVLENLAINAAQAMPHGGTLTLRADKTVANPVLFPLLECGEFLKVELTDTGTGIPPEIMPKVYDPFFTTKETGHGLGLAMCRSIIQRHHGAITLESPAGQGTTATLYLPMEERNSCEDGDETIGSPLQRQFHDARVLAMDDESDVRRLVASILTRSGCRVETVSNVKMAVEAVEQAIATSDPYELILLDLTIAGGPGGAVAAKQIRARDSSVPLVVVSGYTSDPTLADPSRHGFQAALAKPFSAEELVAVAVRWLS